MTEIFKEPPIVAYRRDRNLGDLLVHGKLNRIVNGREIGGKKTCAEKCLICEMCTRSVDMKDTSLKIKGSAKHSECKMWNLVYGISCAKCERVVYVGETGRSLKERMKEHVADVRHRRAKPVADHFSSDGHTEKDMGVTVLERMKDNSRYYRQIKELQWIEKLQTEAPQGLNRKARLGVLWREYK
jgi:Na+-translocating ferredoxin:NAD+ oxidoreductase RnfC subunit